MRHLLIDTDTASDDAVALLLALKEPSVRVEAITVVAGNCQLPQAITNALNTVEQAGEYHPPVYAGAAAPLLKPLETADHVHGSDGMGEMMLPAPRLKAQPTHAVDAIIALAQEFQGELEIVALGPLTNLALALAKEPKLALWVKQLTIMGGQGLGPGNITPVAEFNFWVDAEAAQMVVGSAIPKTLVGWDVCMDDNFLTLEDIDALDQAGPLGAFAVRCNRTLQEFNLTLGKQGFDLPDPTAMMVALYPDIVRDELSAYASVEHHSQGCYGQLLIDHYRLFKQPDNARLVTRIDAGQFKRTLIDALGEARP